MRNSYKSDIVLGESYVDDQTGIQGIATAIYFFQHTCERVQIEYVNKKDGELKELVFDAPRLRHAKSSSEGTVRPSWWTGS